MFGGVLQELFLNRSEVKNLNPATDYSWPMAVEAMMNGYQRAGLLSPSWQYLVCTAVVHAEYAAVPESS
jgi:hypothetical protein